jgi:hypothetical protein
MDNMRLLQGRRISDEDVAYIRRLIADHPHWSRNQIALALAEAWNWRTATGRLKNFAGSSLLLKLETRGLIELPKRRRPPPAHLVRPPEPDLPWPEPDPITGPLSALQPLSIEPLCTKQTGYAVIARYLIGYHYLGFRRSVGENLAYLIRDRQGCDLACALFGAPAWRLRVRDQFIGWDHATLARRLGCITNNTRFLILPWVRVPHLASHLLACITRRLDADWQAKYGHPIYLVETFVDRSRFQGTCYRAANWTCVGQTQGRGRQDRDRTLRVPVKDVYLYPLTPLFREELCRVDG